MLRRNRLSRRSLLGAAARAAVGVAGITMVGCDGPTTYNEPADEGDAPSSRARESEAQSEPAPESGINAAEQQTRSNDNPRSQPAPVGSAGSVTNHDIVDPLAWRQLYHWRKLATAPNSESGPRHGGDITISTPSPVTWSPIPQGLAAAIYGNQPNVLPLLYSQLITLSSGDGVNAHHAAIEGDLAADWEIADPTTIIFNLRRDVKWPSSSSLEGKNLTASDVRATHDLYRQPGTPQAAAYDVVDLIDADNASGAVTFKLAEPNSSILNQMTSPQHVVMPPD